MITSKPKVYGRTDRASRQHRISRRVRAVVAATLSVGLAAAALAGCAGGASSGTSGGASSGTSGMNGKTVKMFTWVGNPDEEAQWTAYIDGGKLEDPALSVEFSGPAIGSYYTKLPTQLKGSDAPCIITLQNGQLEPYASALEPLDSYMTKAGIKASDYDPSMITQLSNGGKVYALPYDAEPMVLFYNKSMFAAAGVPAPTVHWTTNDFVTAAKKTTKGNVYGFALGQGIGPVGNFLAANDEEYVSKDGKADLTSPALQKRLQWFINLATVEKVSRPLEASGGQFPDIDQFSNSQAAMLINGTWDMAHEAKAIGANNLGVAVIPSDNGTPHGSIAGTGFAMTKSCGDKAAAFNAISAMTSAKSQQAVAKSRSQVPARADSLDAWKSSTGAEPAAVVKILTENGRVGVSATNGDKINTLFTQYEVNGFSGKSTAAQILQDVRNGVGQ